MIVEPRPAGEGGQTFRVRAIPAGLRPLLPAGAAAPLRRPVRVWSVGTGELVLRPQGLDRGSEGFGVGEGESPVGEALLDAHTLLRAEPGSVDAEPGSVEAEPGRGAPPLLGQHLDGGAAGGALHGHVHDVAAGAASFRGRAAGGSRAPGARTSLLAMFVPERLPVVLRRQASGFGERRPLDLIAEERSAEAPYEQVTRYQAG